MSRKRFLLGITYLLLLCLVVPCISTIGVYTVAEAAKKKDDKKKTKATEAPKATSTPKATDSGDNDSGSGDSVTKEDINKCVKTVKSKGWSEATVSGLLAIALVESHMNTGAGSSTGKDIGMFQIRNMDGDDDKYKGMTKNIDACKKAGHKIEKNGLCSKWQCQLWAATAYIGDKMTGFAYQTTLQNTYKGQRDRLVKTNYKYLNKFTGKDTISAEEMPDLKKGWSFTKLEYGATASVALVCCWERAAGGLYFDFAKGKKDANGKEWGNPDLKLGDSGQTQGWYAIKECVLRPNIAKALDECFLGKAANTKTSNDTANENAKSAVVAGFLNESDFVQYKKMSDITIEFADISKLSDDENANLELWKDDLEKDKGDNILIKGGRFLTMLAGILFTIWMILIYLAYWLDRINNFIDFDFLPIITFNKLRISPTEEECTFSVKDLGKGETRTINHRHIIGVCICGIAFGCMIISGFIFTIVNSIVTKVLTFIG